MNLLKNIKKKQTRLIDDDQLEALAKYMIQNNLSIRQAAKYSCSVSKSTIHHNIHTRLPYLNIALYVQLNDMFEIHWDNKHINGGKATRKKYKGDNYATID